MDQIQSSAAHGDLDLTVCTQFYQKIPLISCPTYALQSNTVKIRAHQKVFDASLTIDCCLELALLDLHDASLQLILESRF